MNKKYWGFLLLGFGQIHSNGQPIANKQDAVSNFNTTELSAIQAQEEFHFSYVNLNDSTSSEEICDKYILSREYPDGVIREIKENRRLKVWTHSGEELDGKYTILNDSTIALDNKTLLISSIKDFKCQSKETNLAMLGVLLPSFVPSLVAVLFSFDGSYDLMGVGLSISGAMIAIPIVVWVTRIKYRGAKGIKLRIDCSQLEN